MIILLLQEEEHEFLPETDQIIKIVRYDTLGALKLEQSEYAQCLVKAWVRG